MTALVLDDDFIQRAHDVGAKLRESTPIRNVVLPGGLPVWLVTGYEQAKQVMTDRRFSSHRVYDRMHRTNLDEHEESPFHQGMAKNLLNLDPPEHTRLRKAVAASFTSRAVAALRPRIEQIADELLDAIAGQDTVDICAEYAYPLPIRVICELLGVPLDDQEQFTTWSQAMVDGGASEAAGLATMQMGHYLSGLIAAKRAEPGEDLLSQLAQDEQLTDNEVLASAVVLLIGGFETTANLISGGVLSLLRRPDQLALLRAEPELIGGAVEEFLRFETPNNLSSPRYTTEDVTLDGVRIPAGEFVMVSWLSANRDGKRFTDPDRLDITRAPGGHLAFGHGIHHCVGAPLARLEGHIAFDRLLRHFAHIELVAEPELWRPSTAMHGLESLLVRMKEGR